MNLLRKRFGITLALLAGLLVGGVATATPITMDFDGLKPVTSVNNYYDGGCTSWVFGSTCDGPDYGVVWKGARVGSGFAGLSIRGATMNIAAGFDGGLSFDYYSVLFPGSVSVYSGLNGQGTQLAFSTLGATNGWRFFDLTFAGSGQSVIFNGLPLFGTGFDNVTLGVSATAVPEPATLGMFGLGLLLLGLFAGLRRRSN